MTERDESAELDAALEEAIRESEKDSAVQTEDEGSEAVETEVVEDAGEETEAPEIPEELQPVSAWDEAARSAWESFLGNAENHEQLKPLADQFRSDYAYRTQIEQERAQLRERAQIADQFQQVANQYGDLFQGRNPINEIGNYLYYAQQLQKDPQNTIMGLAKQYGVDLNQAIQDQPYISEYEQKLMDEVNQLRSQMQERQQSEQQQQMQQLQQSAVAFESETDAEGNLLHPYARDNEQVAQEMLRLAGYGLVNSWQDAYDRACWSIPEVRAELMKQQGQSRKQQQQEQAKKAKATAAAQPKRGKSSKSQPDGVEGIDGALEKAARELDAA